MEFSLCSFFRRGCSLSVMSSDMSFFTKGL